MSHPWAGREGGEVGEEKPKINHVAGSAAFHRDMLCWNGRGDRAGEGAKSRKRGARKGRNSTGIEWEEGKRWGSWKHHKENRVRMSSGKSRLDVLGKLFTQRWLGTEHSPGE